MAGEVTTFSNIKNTSTPFYKSVPEILERIKNGNSKNLVEGIRKEKDKTKRNKLKMSLPAICFSGKFGKRADTALIEHSGVICLDFDEFESIKAMSEFRKETEKDEFVYSIFTSPSGNGLKILVKIPADPENHRAYFKSLEEYFNTPEFDTTCKNESRVCYESYDPKIYVNDNSIVYTDMSEEAAREIEVDSRKTQQTIIIDDKNKVVENLMKWWEKDYGIVAGKRNENIYILASAFNDYGVDQTMAEYIIGQFKAKDFPASEINRTIESAYVNKAAHGSKAFEDKDKLDSIRRRLKQGESKAEVKEDVLEIVGDEKTAKAIVDAVDKVAMSHIQTYWKKSDKGAISLVPHHYKEYLNDHGFYKYYPEGSDNFIFVRRVSNRVSNAHDNRIKDYVLNYLEKNVEDMGVWDFMAERIKYTDEKFLSMLPNIEIEFMEDTIDVSYLYFNNVALKVTKDDVEEIEYENLPGWVWEDQMINRDWNQCEETSHDYKKFIHNIAGDESDRIDSIESTIGYLLHSYKNKGECPAVILNDEVISDNPEGGTGKGLFMQGVAQLRKSVEIDGKSFNFDKSFPYQTVQQDTQILCFDDVRSSFDFERLFSVITQGITLEKKNKDAIRIPFEKAPKIAITTNYAIKGSGSSFDRRKWELELRQYYTADRTPLTEFGRMLFDDWDVSDWCQFDQYMVKNLQKFLKHGLIKSKFKNLQTRKFISATSHDFFEWIEDKDCQFNRVNIAYSAQAMFYNFIELNPDFAPNRGGGVKQRTFYKWVDAYAMYKHDRKPEIGRDASGKTIEFKTIPVKQAKLM